MSTWDFEIFTAEVNKDFLDELAELEDEDVVQTVRDAILLAVRSDTASDDEIANGRAAATIAAIWSGAPFSAGDVVAAYPFIRSAATDVDEQLAAAAVVVLESVETEEDIDPFIEALS